MPPTTRSKAATTNNLKAKKPAAEPPPSPPATTRSTTARKRSKPKAVKPVKEGSTAAATRKTAATKPKPPPKPPTKKTAAKKTVANALLPEGSIRLLRVTGVDVDGCLTTTLDTCQVDSNPDFYALSYVWGSSVKTQKIICNGKELGVTESVHAALTSLRGTLRLEEPGNPIWIDAICINQNDNDERSRQVARMDWIYREAKLWTFQEAVLARSLQFVCGDFIVNSEAFMTVVHGLGFSAIIDAKKNALGAAGLLMATAERQCKEPLDRVYGLLSSMPGELRRKILVSYTRDINEVYVEMGKACLEEANSLSSRWHYLELVHDGPKDNRLPTWCADLRCISRRTASAFPFDMEVTAGYGLGPEPYEPPIQTFPDSNTLHILGFRADKVDHVSETYHRSLDWKDTISQIHDWLGRGHRLALQTLRDSYGGSEEDILLSHIYSVAATTMTMRPDREAFKQGYQQFLILCGWLTALDRSDKILPLTLSAQKTAISLGDRISGVCHRKSYCTTAQGRICIGPEGTQQGDILVIVPGARPIYVLRERTGEGVFEFIGCAFAHGLMELRRDMTAEEIEKLPWERFCVV
ncbi:Heterokaryon incompatibility protein (HET) domain containing protein [Rhypophila decipiens]